MRARRGKVHFKLSGAYVFGGLDAGLLARPWVGKVGTGRLLWDSDWLCTTQEPRVDYPRLLQGLRTWLGDEAVVETGLLDLALAGATKGRKRRR